MQQCLCMQGCCLCFLPCMLLRFLGSVSWTGNNEDAGVTEQTRSRQGYESIGWCIVPQKQGKRGAATCHPISAQEVWYAKLSPTDLLNKQVLWLLLINEKEKQKLERNQKRSQQVTEQSYGTEIHHPWTKHATRAKTLQPCWHSRVGTLPWHCQGFLSTRGPSVAHCAWAFFLMETVWV